MYYPGLTPKSDEKPDVFSALLIFSCTAVVDHLPVATNFSRRMKRDEGK
jgi:hypothetical protein